MTCFAATKKLPQMSIATHMSIEMSRGGANCDSGLGLAQKPHNTDVNVANTASKYSGV